MDLGRRFSKSQSGFGLDLKYNGPVPNGIVLEEMNITVEPIINRLITNILKYLKLL